MMKEQFTKFIHYSFSEYCKTDEFTSSGNIVESVMMKENIQERR